MKDFPEDTPWRFPETFMLIDALENEIHKE